MSNIDRTRENAALGLLGANGGRRFVQCSGIHIAQHEVALRRGKDARDCAPNAQSSTSHETNTVAEVKLHVGALQTPMGGKYTQKSKLRSESKWCGKETILDAQAALPLTP